MVSYVPAEYEDKVIPAWAEFIGWLMVIAPILCVIGRALKMLIYRKIPVCIFSLLHMCLSLLNIPFSKIVKYYMFSHFINDMEFCN